MLINNITLPEVNKLEVMLNTPSLILKEMAIFGIAVAIEETDINTLIDERLQPFSFERKLDTVLYDINETIILPVEEITQWVLKLRDQKHRSKEKLLREESILEMYGITRYIDSNFINEYDTSPANRETVKLANRYIKRLLGL